MKILVTCDPGIPVPPLKYGGVERIVSMMCREYRKAGHEVYLLASMGSKEKHIHGFFPWWSNRSRGLMNCLKNTLTLWRVSRKIHPDIVHSFSRLLYMYPLFIEQKIPCVMTYGRNLNEKTINKARILGRKKLCFTCCGAHMLDRLTNKQDFYPIHNPYEVGILSYDAEAVRDYSVFLGRIEDIKGTHEAVMAAVKSGENLKIAGNIEKEHQTYFDQKVKPYLNEKIQYVGPVNEQEKQELFRHAKAFLFPIKWKEPFGMVMAEAMGCGVPVIAFRCGSVPEVIADGKTGYIVDTIDEMAKAISDIRKFDGMAIQQYAREHFSPDIIAAQYLDLFKKMLSQL